MWLICSGLATIFWCVILGFILAYEDELVEYKNKKDGTNKTTDDISYPWFTAILMSIVWPITLVVIVIALISIFFESIKEK